MTLPRLFCCLALATALGCGGGTDTSLCDKAGAALAAFSTKAAPCSVPVNFGFTKDKCLSSLSSCTANDKTLISNFSDCLNNLATCSTATAATWSAAVEACTTPMDGVSKACSGA